MVPSFTGVFVTRVRARALLKLVTVTAPPGPPQAQAEVFQKLVRDSIRKLLLLQDLLYMKAVREGGG